jgi:hypothetical protein
MDWTKAIEASAGVLSSLAWPAAGVVMLRMVLKRYHKGIGGLIDRIKSVSYPGGEVQLLEIAAEEKRAEVKVLTEQAAAPDVDEETRRRTVSELVDKAEVYGQLSAWVLQAKAVPVPEDPYRPHVQMGRQMGLFSPAADTTRGRGT